MGPATEMTVEDFARRRAAEPGLAALDVREPPELALANLGPGVHAAPMSELGSRGTPALPEALQDQDAEIVLFCHHGVRSANVAQWLRQQGWTNVKSLRGGIDAWSLRIDPSVPRY